MDKLNAASGLGFLFLSCFAASGAFYVTLLLLNNSILALAFSSANLTFLMFLCI